MGIKFDVIFESSVFRYPRPRESRDIFLASDWLSGSARKAASTAPGSDPARKLASCAPGFSEKDGESYICHRRKK